MNNFEVTDIGLVLFYIYHIDNPCSLEHNGVILDVRHVYLQGARGVLDNHNFENPHAKKLLEMKIREYSHGEGN